MPTAATTSAAILLLAQAKAYNPMPVLIWVGALILAVALLGTGVVYLRKRTLEQQAAANIPASLMEQLREMHRHGEISDAEYEQTRRTMASRVSQVLDTKRSGDLFELPDPKRRPRTHAPRATTNAARAPSASPRPDERIAPPGFDLTGEPLPRPGNLPPSSPQDPQNPSNPTP